jgi:hypothetical protein
VAASAAVCPTINAFVEGVTATVATDRDGLTTGSPESEQAVRKARTAEYTTKCAALRYCMVCDIWVSRFE